MKVKLYLPLLASLSLLGCATNSQITEAVKVPDVPNNWQQKQSELEVTDNWLAQFSQPVLTGLIKEALQNNRSLRQEAYTVEILEQQVIQTKADSWPDLDLSLTTSRAKLAANQQISNSNNLKLESSYEVDLWGKLSDNQQNAQLSYLAAKADYQQSKQELVASIVKNWFNLITASHLVDLFQQRVNNAKQSLDIIESGYQTGVSIALDVYLSRNELNSESSNLAAQQTTLLNAARVLEQQLGRYPSGELAKRVKSLNLPALNTNIPLGMPSAIISRKPQLAAAWYQVLAQDAGLAFAYKQRFPSIRLTASVSNSSDDLSDLLSSSSLAWSLLSGLTAPIFNAGNLKANEEIARLKLKQQEQQYLNVLFSAFADVENAITSEASLQQRYETTLAAKENAMAAENLSFEQYQRGLVSYTTVLDAQGRAFNAQSSLLQIKNQLLSNRINLHLALGGNFEQIPAITNNNNQQDDSTNE